MVILIYFKYVYDLRMKVNVTKHPTICNSSVTLIFAHNKHILRAISKLKRLVTQKPIKIEFAKLRHGI